MQVRTLVVLILLIAARPAWEEGPPFGPGERLQMRISYAHLRGGTATLSVRAAEHRGQVVWSLVAEARSAGFFAWLLRFKVDDRTVATWDPRTGRSLGIEKRLREGRAVRDQMVTIDPESGAAQVQDRKITQTRFDLPPGTLDVLSAFYVARWRGVPEQGRVTLPVFDNGKQYELGVQLVGRERLDLPAPLGRQTPTIIIEPQLLEGTGLFVKEGRLKIWLTDDQRRIPVRMRSKVAVGSVSADLESYTPPEESPQG